MARGEVLSLLGPNGAGKTTTVEILEGYRGASPAKPGSWARTPSGPGRRGGRGRGIVLQSCEDVVDLTVSECVRHFSHFYPRPPRIRTRSSNGWASPLKGIPASGRFQVGNAGGSTSPSGSSGRPELVFLDEPTTGFDPEARRQFWAVVRDLAKEGTSVLLTTHYLEEAEALADRVAVINNGKVIEAGPPSELGGRQEAPARVSWFGPDGWQRVKTDQPTALGETARGNLRRRGPAPDRDTPQPGRHLPELIGAQVRDGRPRNDASPGSSGAPN